MIKGKANILMDGQWGSTGKGKLSGYLATHYSIDVVVGNFMPNAGHTYVSSETGKLVTHHIPTACINEETMVVLGAGCAFNVAKLLEEIDTLNISNRLLIHPNAVIITDDDIKYEAEELNKISSTLQGCGGALSRKILRKAKTAADDCILRQWVGDVGQVINLTLESGGTVLIEGAQGFDLSLNHGTKYPYTTSRDITPMSLLNEAGIPSVWLGDVYGCLRTFPIRVGNVYVDDGTNMVGYSGPFHSDQKEISWEDLAELSGCDGSLVERTTTTNKIRRVFTWSNLQMKKFVRMCAPTKLFVNFINHINHADHKVRTWDELSGESKSWILSLEDMLRDSFGTSVSIPIPEIEYIGTGADNDDMIVLK